MFVEVIRMHMDQLANNNTGWLAGLRDPLVGRVLTLLHARPEHDWTLEELASEAAASRSALADRFTQIVGCPPIQYLTQWRMQIAAKRLADPNLKLPLSLMKSATNPKPHLAGRSRSSSAGRRANGEPARTSRIWRQSAEVPAARDSTSRLSIAGRPGFRQSIAKGKRLTKKTREMVAKVHGKPLGREMLEWASIRLMQPRSTTGR